MKTLALLLTWIALEAHAADPKIIDTRPVPQTVEEPAPTKTYWRTTTPYTVTGNIAPMEMWLSRKWGATFAYNRTAKSSYEIEIAHRRIGGGSWQADFGHISETRISALWRAFPKGKTFNLATGIFYNQLEAKLGDNYAATVGNGTSTLLELDTVGIAFALGNRWQTDGGFVWGFDWFSIYKPVFFLKEEAAFIDGTSNSSYRDDVQDIFDMVKKLPSFGVVKVQLGYSW